MKEQCTPPVAENNRQTNILEMAKALTAGITEKDGLVSVSNEAIVQALVIGQGVAHGRVPQR